MPRSIVLDDGVKLDLGSDPTAGVELPAHARALAVDGTVEEAG